MRKTILALMFALALRGTGLTEEHGDNRRHEHGNKDHHGMPRTIHHDKAFNNPKSSRPRR